MNMMGPRRWRWGRRGPGRPPKPRWIWGFPGRLSFIPFDETGQPINAEPVILRPDEVEAMRLVYYEGLNQEEAAKKMGVSRGTLWRALASGRRKVVQALIERRPLVMGYWEDRIEQQPE